MQSHKQNFYSGSNDGVYIIRILVSFVLICISIVSIFIVYKKVTSIKILERINIKEEAHDSLNITTDTNTEISLFITDDKGLKFRKSDKTFAREEWIDKNGELFYFDTSGYGLNDSLKKDGQVYEFENGKLVSIKRDSSYTYRARDELYSSIESAQYLVWLDSEEKEKTFYPIKYKRTSDDFEDYLGTEDDKQYASPNMMKINLSNIYYLSVGKGTDYAGRLCRMRPGAVHKEVIGVGVVGYIVLSDDVVYYYDGERVIKAKSWKGVEVKEKEILDEDEDGIVDIATISDLPEPDINNLKPDNENILSETKKETNQNSENNVKDVVPIIDLPIPDKKVVKDVEPQIIDDKKPKAVNSPGDIGVGPN